MAPQPPLMTRRSTMTSLPGGGEPARRAFRLNQVLNCCMSQSNSSVGTPPAGQEAEEGEAEAESSVKGKELWRSVRKGDLSRVRELLNNSGEEEVEQMVNSSMPASDSGLTYKSRRVTSQPLHAAAIYQDEATEGDGHGVAATIVKLLLDHKADPKSKARIQGRVGKKEEVRQLEAIHIAAGSGNAEVIRLLVEAEADPNQETTIKRGEGQETFHYRPMHDAAWFNRVNSIKMLIEMRANVLEANNEGNTGMHLAAKLGHVDTVRILTDALIRSGCSCNSNRPRLKRTKSSLCEVAPALNDKNETALDLAVKGGFYPLNQLHLFTQCLSKEARVNAFVNVATLSPEAATALLVKHGNDVQDDELLQNSSHIDKEWRNSFVFGAEQGIITADRVARLIHCAPSAAAYLVEALTDVPAVEDTGHNALPIRAKLGEAFGPCAVSCEYVIECEWKWDRERGNGRRKWHDRIAPLDPKHGTGVCVKVAKLPGIVDISVLHALAETPSYEVFTKITVHALLQLLWKNFRLLFITDLTLEVFVTLIISYWILCAHACHPESVWLVLRRLLWCCVFSYGVLEVINSKLVVVACWMKLGGKLGRKRFGRFALRQYKSFILGWSTLFLAVWGVDTDKGVHGEEASVILALSSLFHWVHVLYQLRAFQPTGRKLLPIQKSVAHICGMLVIMGFLLVAFVHAFWAMYLSAPIEVKLFEVATLLFTGEAFLEGEAVGQMPLDRRVFIIVLTLVSVFIFLACALNVFIAVLGDSYDLEQERMVCTFLKERAKICTALFLRPSYDKSLRQVCLGGEGSYDHHDDEEALEDSVISGKRIVCETLPTLPFFAICLVLLIVSTQVPTQMSGFFVYSAALCMSFSIGLVQVVLRSSLTVKWDRKYLWVCHEEGLEEKMFLMEDNCSHDEYNQAGGREGRLKRFVDQQCRQVALQCKHIQTSLGSLEEDGQADDSPPGPESPKAKGNPETAEDMKARVLLQPSASATSSSLQVPEEKKSFLKNGSNASSPRACNAKERADSKSTKRGILGRLEELGHLLGQKSQSEQTLLGRLEELGPSLGQKSQSELDCRELKQFLDDLSRRLEQKSQAESQEELEHKMQEAESAKTKAEDRCRELERKMQEAECARKEADSRYEALQQKMNELESRRSEAEARCQELQHKIREADRKHHEKTEKMEKEKNHLLKQFLERAMTAREAEVTECKTRLTAEHQRDMLQHRCDCLEARLQALGASPSAWGVPAPVPPGPLWRPEASEGAPPMSRQSSKQSRATPDVLGVIFNKHRTMDPVTHRSRLGPEALRQCVEEVLGDYATPEICEQVKQYPDGIERREFYKFFSRVCSMVDSTQRGAAILRVAQVNSDGSQQ